MKAIETQYKGRRFRSRLEARWAVLFDRLGIEWEYEPEGFHTRVGPYLPDFYLPQVAMYAEVKPPEGFTADAVNKTTYLAEATDRPVLWLDGTPKARMYAGVEHFLCDGDKVHVFGAIFDILDGNAYWKTEHRFYCYEGFYLPAVVSPEDGWARGTDVSPWWFRETCPAATDDFGGVQAAVSARFEYGENGAGPCQRKGGWVPRNGGWGHRPKPWL